MKNIRLILSALSGVPIALVYGVIARYIFGMPQTSGFFGTMTFGFLFLVPIAIGALTVRFAPEEYRASSSFRMFMPWLSILIVVIGSVVLQIEAAICIVMAFPLFALLGSLGGHLAKNRKAKSSAQNNILTILLFAPYFITPLETRIPEINSFRIVENQITIDASVDKVWQNIITVPYIRPEEQGFSAFHLLGVPKPLEATLSHEGIGGVRNASFEGGLSFTETITHWQDKHSLRFSIVPNKQPQLPQPFDQIGGRYFDVLDGSYWIEPVDENTVILHLSSKHRLSTHFNYYGGLWTDYIMSDLQSYILRIIKARAES